MGSVLAFIQTIPHPVWWVVGALFLALGLSFVYKGWNATVLGRINYWAGFLPLTIVSPWFIHLPPGKNSLIKQREGLLCHMLIGPLFFLTSAPFLVLGADLLGLQGTNAVNLIINHGDKSQPPAITYSPPINYTFPIAFRAGKKINQIFQTQIYEDPSKSLLPGEHKAGQQQTAQDKYGH